MEHYPMIVDRGSQAVGGEPDEVIYKSQTSCSNLKNKFFKDESGRSRS